MTLYAAFGQAESEAGRASTKMAIERKLKNGESIKQLQRIFGYSKNELGETTPDQNAKWVIKIFQMAAGGFTVSQIVNYLNGAGIKTQNGAKFYRATISRIITNEEYKGDFIQMKHFVDDNRKFRKNKGELPMYCFHEDHLALVSNDLWEKAQTAIDIRKRKKIPEQKILLNDENYPYRHQLYCGKCGNKLMRIYTGDKYRWSCSMKERFSKDFCSGVSITDEEVKRWGQFAEKRYITERKDCGRVIGFEWVGEEEWKEKHTRKLHQSQAPELTEEIYPYKDRIFCKYCGSRLRRLINRNGTVTWICDNFSRNGKKACKGIRVPDAKLQSLRKNTRIVYIGKENINGKECYGYSSQPDQRKA